jgi:hypothetical protein
MKDQIVSTGVYELGSGGKLVKINADGKNDLEIGTVIHWGGNSEQDYVIVENQGINDFNASYGARYNAISLDSKHYRIIDAYNMKWPAMDETWHSQHMYITDRVIDPDELETLVTEADELKAKEDAEAATAQQERERLIAKGKELADRLIPKDAKALIVAYSEIDDCDSMTDYFATHTEECVVLGWSKHNRDLFPEMRKYADRIDETAHLATAPTVDHNGEQRTDANKKWWHPADEHREKYSMGAGYYLKATSRYRTGWKIRKETKWHDDWSEKILKGLALRCVLPEPGAKRTQEQVKNATDGVSVTLNDDKGGIEIRFPEKPDNDILSALKEHGWRWSRFNGCWYHKQSDANMEFANGLAG